MPKRSILTKSEQAELAALCKETMHFSSQVSGGVFGAAAGRDSQLLELRRAIASLDAMSGTNDRKKLSLALDKYEAALQSYVSLSGSGLTIGQLSRVSPEEADRLLEKIDAMRNKHSFSRKTTDPVPVQPAEETTWHSTNPMVGASLTVLIIVAIGFFAALLWPREWALRVGPEYFISRNPLECNLAQIDESYFEPRMTYGAPFAAVMVDGVSLGDRSIISSNDAFLAFKCRGKTGVNLVGLLGAVVVYGYLAKVLLKDDTPTETK